MGTMTATKRDTLSKAAIAAAAKSDSKVAQSQSDKMLAPYFAGIDHAKATEGVGRMAMFTFAETMLAKAGKDKAFGNGKEAKLAIAPLCQHYSQINHRGSKAWEPLTGESLRVTVANWERFYLVGQQKNGFEVLAEVRKALEKSGGRVWLNAGKMMSYALKCAREGKLPDEKGLMATLASEPQTLEQKYKAYADNIEKTVKSGRAKLDRGEEGFSRKVLNLMEKAGQAAREEEQALAAIREAAEKA